MINFLQNILIVPSFYCEKRCKYCFYYDKTNDRVQLDISTLLSKLDQVIQTIRPSNIAGLNIGGGGDISLLSVDYIDQLYSSAIDWCNKHDVNNNILTVTNLTNIGVVEHILKMFNVELNVSLNSQRPFNSQTETKLLKLNRYGRKLTILSTVFPSLLKTDPQKLLQYYEQFKPDQVIFNQYIKSIHSPKHYNVTNQQYCDFLISVTKEYYDGCYSFDLVNVKERNWVLGLDKLSSADLLINPYGNYQLTCYDGDVEYYKQHNCFNDWLKDASAEVFDSQRECVFCKYNSKCASRMIGYDKKNDICPGLIPFIKFLDEQYRH